MNHSNRLLMQQQQHISRQVKQADAGRFFDLLTDPQLLDCVEKHLPQHRERRYPPAVTLSMFLGQAMSADRSCQHAINQLNMSRMLNQRPAFSARTGGYCLARQRLPMEMVQALTQRSGQLLSDKTPSDWRWRGREVKLVDGTTVAMPDTEDNQSSYPQPASQAPGAGAPLARLVGIISLSSGAVLDVAMGPYQGKSTGEHSLFRSIRDRLESGDILLADSYYCSYFLMASLMSRGVDIVFEQHGARRTDFRRGHKLGVRDHRVSWPKPARPQWMTAEEYRQYPDQLQVREVKVKNKVLVTTLLAARETPKGCLGQLYRQRWQVELDFRNIKTTLGMEALSCKSAAMCEKEIWVYMLAYNLIRLLMAEAALRAGMLPRQISFKHTLQLWTAWNQRRSMLNSEPELDVLFLLVAQIEVGNRPDRVEPRAVKRRPKPYPRLTKPRQLERERIRAKGHDKKQGLN